MNDALTPSPRNDLGHVGFSNGSTYAAGRPGYCEESVNFLIAQLGIDDNCRLLDLGAGTGKLTEQLVGTGATITAVEPSASMRAEFHDILPLVSIFDGTGEAIPLEDNSCDVVVVAQAFHWFDPERALAEIARVLTKTGRLGLVWNERDESVAWVHDLSVAMQWTTRQPYRVGTDFVPVVINNGPFTHAQRARFTFSDAMDHERIRQRVLSTSYVAAANDDERNSIMNAVEEVIRRLPDVVHMPYIADTYCFAVDGP